MLTDEEWVAAWSLICALQPLIELLDRGHRPRYINSIGKEKTQHLIAEYHKARLALLNTEMREALVP